MKIKVLKTIFASKDQTGTKIFEYEAGEVYDIYQELAEVFISQGWGVAEELEIETQDIEIQIETQDFPKKKQSKKEKEKDAN
jgi:hypothetical protein